MLCPLLQVMRDTDVDGSGAIDYEEFLAATVNMSLLEREEVLMKTFQVGRRQCHPHLGTCVFLFVLMKAFQVGAWLVLVSLVCQLWECCALMAGETI